jgi:hypothetical protein
MIKIIRREKTKTPSSFPLYKYREIVYTCLNKLGIEKARTTCRNTIRLHRGLFNWTKYTYVLRKMSQSFWCSYYCIFSYIAIIFFFKSSKVVQLIPLLKADLEVREYLVLYNVVIFPSRGPCIHVHLAWISRKNLKLKFEFYLKSKISSQMRFCSNCIAWSDLSLISTEWKLLRS